MINTKKFSTIDFDKDNNTGTSDPIETTIESRPVDRSESPLVGMIPDGYHLVQFLDKGKRGFTCYYEDDTGNVISFMATPAEGILNVDTEDAEVKDIELLGHSGVLIKKDGNTIMWFDTSASICYQVRSTGLDRSELWALAEEVAGCSEWVNLIFGGKV